MTIIEINDGSVVREHGNLWNTPSNQLRRKLGRYTTTYAGDRDGTVRDAEGNQWDWWIDDNGVVVAVPAR